MKARIACILLAGVLAACGSDDDDDGAFVSDDAVTADGQVVADDADTAVGQVVADLNGDYTLTAPAVTEFDVNGGTCGDGSGTLTLTDGVISGSALSTNGLAFELNGNVADDGVVSGGFAFSGENVVMFVGAIVGTTGSGTWEDEFECMGTWEALLNP